MRKKVAKKAKQKTQRARESEGVKKTGKGTVWA